MHFDAGRVHVQDWQAMDDEAIIAELVAIRGIGRWTAEMFLIFYLMRPNVLPLDDVGPDQRHQPQLFFRRIRSAAAMPAKWPPPGRLIAAWRLGIFGALWTDGAGAGGRAQLHRTGFKI